MNREAFTKALRSKLFPLLRKEGFRGSGTTLRRINEPIVHVLNVQGSTGGTECFLNMGAHLVFLPSPGGTTVDPSRIKEYECAFRDRFDPPPGPGFGWSYGETENEMNESIQFICDHWSMDGHEFFGRYSDYPAGFIALVESVDVDAVHPIDLLTFAFIARKLGLDTCTQSIAHEGLRRCPERATSLRYHLERLLENGGKT